MSSFFANEAINFSEAVCISDANTNFIMLFLRSAIVKISCKTVALKDGDISFKKLLNSYYASWVA